MPIDITTPAQYASKLGCKLDPTFDNAPIIQEVLNGGYRFIHDIPGVLAISPIHIPRGNCGYISGSSPGKRGIGKGYTAFTEFTTDQTELITVNKAGVNTGCGKQVVVEDIGLECKNPNTIALGIYGAEACEVNRVGIYGGLEGVRVHAIDRLIGVTINSLFTNLTTIGIRAIQGASTCCLQIIGGSLNLGNHGVYLEKWANQCHIQGLTAQAQLKSCIEMTTAQAIIVSSYLESSTDVPCVRAVRASRVVLFNSSLTRHAISTDSRMDTLFSLVGASLPINP